MRSTCNSETDYSSSETDGYMCLHISTGYGHILLYHCIVDLKQSASYFSSKNRLIEDQQRITIWNLQPWEVTRQSPHSKGKRKLGRLSKQSPVEELRVWSLVAFHWLSYDISSLAELFLDKKGKFPLPVGLSYCPGSWEFPLLVSWLYYDEDFFLLIFIR